MTFQPLNKVYDLCLRNETIKKETLQKGHIVYDFELFIIYTTDARAGFKSEL